MLGLLIAGSDAAEGDLLVLWAEKLKLSQQVLQHLCQILGTNCNPTYCRFLTIYGDAKARTAQLKMQVGMISRLEFLHQLRESVAIQAKAKAILKMQ